MIIPIFAISQSDHFLVLKLHIPLGDLSNSELLVEDGIFYFSAAPYYLRLDLPGPVLEVENQIQFSLDAGDLTVTLKKATPGEHFSDLDLLSKFIIKPNVTNVGITEMDSGIDEECDENIYNWYRIPSEDPYESSVKLHACCYGFANSKSGLFASKPEVALPIDLPNPDKTAINERRKMQMASVQEHFKPEHYIADFCEPEASAGAVAYIVPWLNGNTETSSRPPFTNDHRHRLTVLANRRLPLLPPVPTPVLEEPDRAYVYLGLVDLLLAFTYDLRCREGDENSESSWVIGKLAATLSWLEFPPLQVFTNVSTLLQTFYERALSFPLIRNWNLCRKVHADVGGLLQSKQVKSWCLYILLEIRSFLIEYPGYYIFVDLFLDDYVVWIQKSASVGVLNDLGKCIASCKVKKTDTSLPLEQLEKISVDILQSEKLAESLNSITLLS